MKINAVRFKRANFQQAQNFNVKFLSHNKQQNGWRVWLYDNIPADDCPAVQVVLKKDKEKAHQQYKEGDLNISSLNKDPHGQCMVLKPFLIHPGFSCPRCVQDSLSQNCLKLTITVFYYDLLPVTRYLVVILVLQKSIDHVISWKSGHTVTLLPLGSSCPLQAFFCLIRSSVVYPLQIVIAV